MQSFARLALLAVVLSVAAAPAAAAPSDGNANQSVVVVDESFPVDCGAGGMIDGHVEGWFKGREFTGDGNRNVFLTVFHLVVTYTNDEGETFRYVDVGPDHGSIDRDGNFVLTITGRPGGAGGASLQGHWVLVFDPAGNLLSITPHGNLGPPADELACAALT